MKSSTELFEREFLADYAIKSISSKGRRYHESDCPLRTCFQRDRDRIVHSKAFRRLKQKTQVFLATESDHYRSRLTHTLEVVQISRLIARSLALNEDLAECIALAHDLGHTPFGHSGEAVLKVLLKNTGGFEHNQQSLRVVDELENKYPHFQGLNLSYEIRKGLLKHTVHNDPSTVIQGASLEAQVVNIADEIAYNNHDLDDGLSAQLLIESQLEKHCALFSEIKKNVEQDHASLLPHQRRHLINRQLITAQILDVINHSKKLQY